MQEYFDQKKISASQNMVNVTVEADRRPEKAESAILFSQKRSCRSRENPKERLQYHAARTTGTEATEGTGNELVEMSW